MQVMNKGFTLDISRAQHYLDTTSQGQPVDRSRWGFCSWWKAQDAAFK
jgi:hypothetical protein